MSTPRRPDRRPAVRVPRPGLTPPRVRRQLSTRPLWGVVAVVLLLGVVLAGRLGQLQLAQHEELAEQAAEVSTRTLHTPALRGRILAADGTPLVVNAPTSVVTVDPELLLPLVVDRFGSTQKAAIDVVAEAASERGVEVVLAGSDVQAADGQDLDAELLRLAEEASA